MTEITSKSLSRSQGSYLKRSVTVIRGGLPNWQLTIGALLLGALVTSGVVGPLIVGQGGLQLGAAPFGKPPTADHLLGTDTFGRDLLTMLLHAIVPSLGVGLIAGGVGMFIGAILGLWAGYQRGLIDEIVRTAADVAMTIPSLVILIVIASFVRATSLSLIALIIALFSWPFPTRTVRAQTISLREQPFVLLARLSGLSAWQIILFELAPNLLPYVMAGFVGAVNGGILAAVGLQLLGLGPRDVATLGSMLEEAFRAGGLVRGFWWWWAPPTIILAILFIGLLFISMGFDEIANPRLRGSKAGAAV